MEKLDETNHLRGTWRCSECGGLNSLEFDNVCRRCLENALSEDEIKITALGPHRAKAFPVRT